MVLQTAQTEDWMERHLFAYASNPNMLGAMRQAISCVRFLREFAKGRSLMAFFCHLVKDDMILVDKITVYLFENSTNGHVEAQLFLEDITQEYMDTITNEVLSQKDYKILGLISLDRGVVNFRRCRLEGVAITERKNLSYEEIRNRFCEKHILAGDRERFSAGTEISWMKTCMADREQYSFTVRSTENTSERYTYYWFDRADNMLLFVVNDMTQELESDPLTGIPNRAGFFRQVEEILGQKTGTSYAILFFNIQRFKAINDLFGYEKGDRILKDFVQMLKESFLKPLVTARMEADRFVALVDTENLKTEQLTEILHYSYQNGGSRIELQGRCGIYYIPSVCTLSVSDMCDRAKLAKNYISNQYVQPYAIYDDSMKTEYDENSRVMINLEQAIGKQEFHVYYQPVYDAKTEEIVSAEALVRWIPDKKKTVLPGRFIPVLENSGHITKLDAFVNKMVQDALEKSVIGMERKFFRWLSIFPAWI